MDLAPYPSKSIGLVDFAVPALANASTTATNAPGPAVVLTTPGVVGAKIYNTADVDTTLKPFTATGQVAIPASTGSVSVADTGSGKAVTATVAVPVTISTIQPSLYVSFIIAVEGIHPDRP
ncbi:MAG: hypothetical protein VB101_12170 [Rhodospirillaceae bacterium]|nr:hypothetical protein [Rhodospirillaceae bacterium]